MQISTVMATSSKPVGHECEFVDQVPEDYFCRQCSHVAREPTIASCCTEVFCKACVEAIIGDKRPCPNCQETDISYIPHKKNKTKILALKVHCSLKDRGCEWTGQLQHLDAHLDLTTGDCVYVDVDCPSKCNQKVQKRNVDTHLANHCPNRDYTCPHCSFKATFREVSEHYDVCRYYPLVCPNRCGASFERDVLEEHMKMCSQQELQCEFSYAGCEAEFIRDHQKEHMEQNTQKHLALVAAATLRISQTFERKLQEQQRELDQKLEDKDSEIKAIVKNEASQLVNEQRQQSDARIRDLEEKVQTQVQEKQMANRKYVETEIKLALELQEQMFEKKLGEQREEIHKQQRMLEEKDQQIKALEEQFGSAIDRLRSRICQVLRFAEYEFKLNSFQKAKDDCEIVRSPSMYTHSEGYNFYLMLYTDGLFDGISTHLSVSVHSLKGDHDDKLKFPARFTITLELLNQHRDQDHHRRDIQCVGTRETIKKQEEVGSNWKFISHAGLKWNQCNQTQYLKNDCLLFKVLIF